MTTAIDIIPVVLFACARAVHVARALGCLKDHGVPLNFAYADGAKGRADAAVAVVAIRTLLPAVDRHELYLTALTRRLGSPGLDYPS